MKRLAPLATMLLWLASASAATLNGAGYTLSVEPSGCGLVDKLTWAGHDLLSAPAGFVGASLTPNSCRRATAP